MVWNDKSLRTLFIVISAVNLFVNGPILVGIPVLADTRFPEGAAAFGTIMSAYGGGNLLGTILAMVLPKVESKRFVSMMLIIICTLGIGVVLLGISRTVPFAVIIGLVMGVANGYVVILFITWLQNKTPQAMLGRLMSLLMFVAMGMNPISMAIAGVFIGMNATTTFIVMGSLMTLIVLIAAFNPHIREMELVEE